MEILILVLAMVLVGVIVGAIAGAIWKDNRPLGVRGDFGLAILAAILIGLLDWYVIPAMGFSDSMKYLGVAIEPALGALAVLWICRRANK